MSKGFLISELADGGVYECRLSGLPVLIIKTQAGAIESYQYNPVTGQYQVINVRDHQLKYPSK